MKEGDGILPGRMQDVVIDRVDDVAPVSLSSGRDDVEGILIGTV
jgi:hypothetical protein